VGAGRLHSPGHGNFLDSEVLLIANAGGRHLAQEQSGAQADQQREGRGHGAGAAAAIFMQ
jgi:hypothetical protein